MATIVEETPEKIKGLNVIMAKYGGRGKGWEYAQKNLDRIVLVKIDIEELTGKKAGE